MIKASKVTAALVWSILLIFGFANLATQTKALSDRHYRLLEPPPLTEFRSELIDIVTLGFRAAYDHMVTIWIMQFLFDPKIDAYSAEDIHKTLLATTRHHPKSPGLYLSSCFYLTFNRGRPELCEGIILDGMKALPGEWRLPATQGFVEAFRLKNVSKAIVYYSIAANLPDSPSFMKNAVASLKNLGTVDTNTLNATLQSVAGDGVDSQIAEFIQQIAKQRPEDSPRSETNSPKENAP